MLGCFGQRVPTDRAQGGIPAWTALSPSPMFWMNHTEWKMNSVFRANQSLRSVLNPRIRKLRQPKWVIGIDRPVTEATDWLQTKSWQKGLWAKAWEQAVLNTSGAFQWEGKSKGSSLNRLLHSPWVLKYLLLLPCGDDLQLIVTCLDSDCCNFCYPNSKTCCVRTVNGETSKKPSYIMWGHWVS